MGIACHFSSACWETCANVERFDIEWIMVMVGAFLSYIVLMGLIWQGGNWGHPLVINLLITKGNFAISQAKTRAFHNL
ncbi:MAG: hypothetical protein AYP45_05420 [Candidatus Brocadia carolinensis]|uniref:Uncharacterized protein n=1 Tax=Candidatus Brocadia carolinensis TaxID=1004156 RepID=A0A1V4AVB6_9BACT|nr:MAG: hypothetical protein AYP45_05420 [Candidatus Brocadia caroliniensis]